LATASLTLAGLLAGAQLVGAADLYFEQETVARFNDQPGRRVVSRVWHSGPRMRIETGEPGETAVLILRLEQQQAYRLDPQGRRYESLDLAELRTRSHLELATAADLMGGDPARSQPLERSQMVAGYRCRGVRIRAGSVVMDVYLTDELPVGMEAFTRLLEWSGAEQALGPILAEVRRLTGFPMLTRTRLQIAGGMQETLATVTTVRVGPIPDERFAPPPDFERVEGPVEPPRAGGDGGQ
jgi:hypothetical protein